MAVSSEQLAVSSGEEISLKEQLDFCERNVKEQKQIAECFSVQAEIHKLKIFEAVRDTIRIEYLLEQEAKKYTIKEGAMTEK